MRLAVFGLQKSDNRMGDYFRRMKARLGKTEGLVATAHELIRILYGIIQSQKPTTKSKPSASPPRTSPAAAATSKNKPPPSACNSLKPPNLPNSSQEAFHALGFESARRLETRLGRPATALTGNPPHHYLKSHHY